MKKFCIYSLIVAILIFSGCKEDDNNPFGNSSQGYIKGKLDIFLWGATINGAFSEDFSFTQKLGFAGDAAGSYFEVIEDISGTVVRMSRQDITSGSYITISFLILDDSPADPVNREVAFRLVREHSNHVLDIDLEVNNDDDIEIENLSFSKETGRVTGSYTVSTIYDDEPTTLKGSFDVVVKERLGEN